MEIDLTESFLEEVIMAHIRADFGRRDITGLGYHTCVLTSVGGTSHTGLGQHTYVLTSAEGTSHTGLG